MASQNYKQMFADALMKQTQNQEQDPAYQQYKNEVMKPNSAASMAPTLGLIDHFAGTNLAAQAPKQESMKDKLAQMLALKQQQDQMKLSGLGKLAAIQGQSEDKASQRAFQQQMYDLQLAKAKMKAGAPPKLGAEDKQKLGYTTTLLKELPKLQAMYENGTATVRPGLVGTLMGQNDSEVLINALAENYGRLQSGGAISKDEEERFKSRLGGVMDSPEIRKAKLQQIMEEIQDKHNLYGGGGLGATNARMPSGGSSSVRNFDPSTANEAELDLWLAQNGGN